MHRKRLLARLDVTTENAAERALSPFSQRPGVPAKSKRLSLVLDDIAIPKGHRVGPFSQGLRRWSERPCFEDRVIVYLPSEDAEYSVRYERVSSSYAVEALGFSEELELLGALDEVQVQDAVFSPPLASPVPELSLTPSTASSTSIPPTPILTGSTSSLVGTNTKPFPSGESFVHVYQPVLIFSFSHVQSSPFALANGEHGFITQVSITVATLRQLSCSQHSSVSYAWNVPVPYFAGPFSAQSSAEFNTEPSVELGAES